MSKTGVIVALLVALSLLGAAFLLGGKGHGAALPAGPLLAFDPAKVRELRVARPDGSFDAVRRGEAPGVWNVILSEKGAEAVWPADAGRMRAALRILSTLEGDTPVGPGAAVETGAPEVRLMLDDQTDRRMRVSQRVLAGKVLVEVTTGSSPRPALVGADVGAMLAGTGLREWRDRAALPGLGPEVALIALRGERGSLTLARVQGRWGVREPIAEAADQDAVLRLVGVLGNIQVADFLDGGAPARTGLESPIAEVTIACDQRDEQGKAHTTTRTLRIGQQADIAGKTVFAAMPVDGGGSRTVIVSAEGLSGLTTDPAAYLSRRAIDGAAADIGVLVVAPSGGQSQRYERELDGWSSVGPGGIKTPCTTADGEAVSGLLNLFTQVSAEAVAAATSAPAAWGTSAPIATVDCRSRGDSPIATVGVFTVSPTGKPPQLVLQSGKAVRRYPVEASSPLVAWLSRAP
jgi:hypothetical protein